MTHCGEAMLRRFCFGTRTGSSIASTETGRSAVCRCAPHATDSSRGIAVDHRVCPGPIRSTGERCRALSFTQQFSADEAHLIHRAVTSRERSDRGARRRPRLAGEGTLPPESVGLAGHPAFRWFRPLVAGERDSAAQSNLGRRTGRTDEGHHLWTRFTRATGASQVRRLEGPGVASTGEGEHTRQREHELSSWRTGPPPAANEK